nr:3-oxoacyl-[acyl-carrier-protein] synthase I, chloroplastic [Ipomoea batatas]
MQALQLHRAPPLAPRPAPEDDVRTSHAGVAVQAAPQASYAVVFRRLRPPTPQREKDPKKRVASSPVDGASYPSSAMTWTPYYDKLLAGGEAASPPSIRFERLQIPHPIRAARFGGLSRGYIDGKNDRRLDDCLGLIRSEAGILVELEWVRLQFSLNGVQALIEKWLQEITPFFIPYCHNQHGLFCFGLLLTLVLWDAKLTRFQLLCATSNYCFYAACQCIFVRGEADLMFRQVNYINGSMQLTSTLVGDLAEVNAIKEESRNPQWSLTQSQTRNSSMKSMLREKDPKKRVVITGMGLVSVFGNDVDAYYDKLLAGESGISAIDRFDASKFPTRFGGQIRGFKSEGYIDGKNDRRLDDCLRYCIVAGKKALENADLGADGIGKIDKERAGILVGTGMGGLTVFSDGVQALIEKGYRKITPFFIPYAITNMGSALLAIDLGFMGPNYSISTACATSNYCFYAAANHIRRGEADLMLAGGTEAAIIPIGLGGFVACRALSQRNDDPQTASRPWDKDRDGFVMGEGAGVLVMESLEHAMKRGAPIIAEYLGGAVTCDAYHMTDPRADGLGVSSCIHSALEDAGVSPEEVNYINAHATSTLVGDLAEVNAIKKVFKNTSEIKMNATKSMIGHCLGAAGGLEAIASVKAITTGWLHPTINQFNPEPSVEFDTVPNKKQQHEVNVAISNSFGFGGHNSVVAFSAFKP